MTTRMNGWALRILVSAGVVAFMAVQGWSASEIARLGEVTGRLDERVMALTLQMSQINRTDARIRSLERRAKAGEHMP